MTFSCLSWDFWSTCSLTLSSSLCRWMDSSKSSIDLCASWRRPEKSSFSPSAARIRDSISAIMVRDISSSIIVDADFPRKSLISSSSSANFLFQCPSFATILRENSFVTSLIFAPASICVWTRIFSSSATCFSIPLILVSVSNVCLALVSSRAFWSESLSTTSSRILPSFLSHEWIYRSFNSRSVLECSVLAAWRRCSKSARARLSSNKSCCCWIWDLTAFSQWSSYAEFCDWRSGVSTLTKQLSLDLVASISSAMLILSKLDDAELLEYCEDSCSSPPIKPSNSRNWSAIFCDGGVIDFFDDLVVLWLRKEELRESGVLSCDDMLTIMGASVATAAGGGGNIVLFLIGLASLNSSSEDEWTTDWNGGRKIMSFSIVEFGVPCDWERIGGGGGGSLSLSRVLVVVELPLLVGMNCPILVPRSLLLVVGSDTFLWDPQIDWTVMILFLWDNCSNLIISSYVVAAINSPSASTFNTKSPQEILPDFLACPGSFGPPSTNLATRQPYRGDSFTGSNCKPTGPGTKTTVFSFPAVVVVLDDDNNGNDSVAESDFFPVALELLFGVRTLTTFFFLRLDCTDRWDLSTLLRKGVPNFLAFDDDWCSC